MQQFRKIAAISFLSIFSMYLLHQVLPHVHHEHGSAMHISISEAEHSHDHHHHPHDKDNSDEDFDLLGFLLGTHTHSVQVENILVVKRISKHHLSVKIDLADIPYLASLSQQRPEAEKIWQHPPEPVKSPTISSVSLRGPPSLG